MSDRDTVARIRGWLSSATVAMLAPVDDATVSSNGPAVDIRNSGGTLTISDNDGGGGPWGSAGAFVGSMGPNASVCGIFDNNTITGDSLIPWQSGGEFGIPGYMGGPYDVGAVNSFLDGFNNATLDAQTSNSGAGFGDALSYCP